MPCRRINCWRRRTSVPDGFEIREETRVTDRYDAEHRIAATYAMVDLAVGPRWRFALGARIERSTQEVLTFNPFDPTRNRQQSLLENTDPLPAVNAIYALTGGTNLRFGYSQTISRPELPGAGAVRLHGRDRRPHGFGQPRSAAGQDPQLRRPLGVVSGAGINWWRRASSSSSSTIPSSRSCSPRWGCGPRSGMRKAPATTESNWNFGATWGSRIRC